MVAELQALILISQILAMLRQSRKELFIQLFYQLALQSNYFDKGLIKEAIAFSIKAARPYQYLVITALLLRFTLQSSIKESSSEIAIPTVRIN